MHQVDQREASGHEGFIRLSHQLWKGVCVGAQAPQRFVPVEQALLRFYKEGLRENELESAVRRVSHMLAERLPPAGTLSDEDTLCRQSNAS